MRRNKVLKAITAVAVVMIMMGATCIDSPNMYVPAAMILTGSAWLIPFFIVNGDRHV